MTSTIKKAKTKIHPHSDDTHRKPQTQISTVFFFFFFSATTRLHESFDGSNSSLSCPRSELSLSAHAASGRLILFLQFPDFGVKWFFCHNSGSRHATRSFKSSIDADDRLVSKTILSQKSGSLDWRPGSVKFCQIFKNAPLLWRPPKRTPNANQIIFF